MGTRHLLRRRPVRLAIAVFLLVDVAVLGTDVYLLANRSTTTTVDLQDALMTFRSAGESDPAATPVATADVGPTVPTPSVAAPVVAPTGSAAGMGASPSSTEAPAPSSSTSSAPAPATIAPPAEGVYAYRTSGGESVSVLGAHHDYPATTYTVVRRTGGCGWHIRAEVVKEHVDERDVCSGPDQVGQRAQSRQVTFFGTTDGGAYVCDPAAVQFSVGDAVGNRVESDCGDSASSAHLVRTVLGRGTETIGGVTVEVVRIRVVGTVRGRATGTSVDLFTLVASTGLPVHWERSVDTVADAFGSHVRYQEQAQFDLVSLTPTT